MIKKILVIIIVIIIFTNKIYSDIDKDFFKFTSIKDILHNMIEKYDAIKTYKAKFHIKTIIDNKEENSFGEIKYEYPDRFIMTYDNPKDQIIYSDGKILKIYVPKLNILGLQNLEHYRPGILLNGKTSLFYLQNKYNFSFYKSNKPIMIGDMAYYVLLLEQKDVTAGFKSIILYISQYWVIVKAEATTLNGNKINISFNNIRVNTKITDNEFEFSLPVNTQTVKNPLLFKIEGD